MHQSPIIFSNTISWHALGYFDCPSCDVVLPPLSSSLRTFTPLKSPPKYNAQDTKKKENPHTNAHALLELGQLGLIHGVLMLKK
jgi:hypothetical protein